MLSKDEIQKLMSDMESDHVERTVSTDNTDKFGEAVCALSNDISNSKKPGYLLIGVDDKTGEPSIKFYQYADRIEIINPGGLYGNARPENFPNVSDYRNLVLAEAMRVMGFVNRFNRGIATAQQELVENGNGKAIFDINTFGVFGVTIMEKVIGSEDDVEGAENKKNVDNGKANKTAQNKEKVLTLLMDNPKITAQEIGNNMSMTIRNVRRILAELTNEKKIGRKGSNKDGEWVFIEEDAKSSEMSP